MRNSFEVRATLVADEFIDRYMPEANGEYVKVYLYLLRHAGRQVTVVELADALNHTESDIRRALAYWERLGVLTADDREKAEEPTGESGAPAENQTREGSAKERRTAAGNGRQTGAGGLQETGRQRESGRQQEAGIWRQQDAGAGERQENGIRRQQETGTGERQEAEAERQQEVGTWRQQETGVGRQQAAGTETLRVGAPAQEMPGRLPDARIPAQRETYTPEQVKMLSEDEEFTQLLYVAQKYLNKVFTPRDCEVFAYLYDGLRLPAELLEYLVEYCVQGGHDSIRYLETVGLNWHEKGINTVERAKQYTASYSNEAFAVMRAFGLSDRRPGSSEMEMIHRWFREWGFTKDMILEACARTLAATNKPSFAYTDRILMEWKKAEARTMEDVRKLDEEREKARSAETAAGKGAQPAPQAAGQPAGKSSGPAAREGGPAGSRGTSRAAVSSGARNRFHNFEQRDTDYDAIVLRQLKERLGKQ